MLRVCRTCLSLLLFIVLFCGDSQASSKKILAEALLAKVGSEAVRYSDLLRFLAVEEVMICSKVRRRIGERFEPLVDSLNRYVNEELIYLEARVRVTEGSGVFSDAIKKIKADEKCRSRWRALGQKYGSLWSSRTRPKAGEGMLIRELEKRLLVDQYQRQRLGTDRVSWLRDVRLKIPVKIYVD